MCAVFLGALPPHDARPPQGTAARPLTLAGTGTVAIYHLSAKVISRSSGRSAVAAAAYRHGERLIDQRQGRECDYSRKGGIEHSEILAPDNAPAWMRDRGQLWNAVEAVEKRRDAQLSREIELALPHELSADQRRELVRAFVRDQFVSRGMVADVAIHAPSRHGDDRNHHAHIMLTTRALTAEGFGPKAREWNRAEQLEQWREAWAQHSNRALERAQVHERVDHRCLEAQRAEATQGGFLDRADALDRAPTIKLGPEASALERQAQVDAARQGRPYEPVTDRGRQHQEILRENAERRRLRDQLREWQRQTVEKARELARQVADQARETLSTAIGKADLSKLREAGRETLAQGLAKADLSKLREANRERQRQEPQQNQQERRGLTRSRGGPDRGWSR